MSSSSAKQVDDQHKTQRRMKKYFMSNKVVKGLKEKMSELIATSNCQKMKSWSYDQNNKLAEVVHHAFTKCKGKNQIEKKMNHEEKYDETWRQKTMILEKLNEGIMEEEEKDSRLKRLDELDKNIKKAKETVREFEEVFEKLARKYITTVKYDEEEQMSDESESGYCTPDLNLD